MSFEIFADLRGQRRLAACLEERLELDVDVEVVLDGVLAAAGDQDDVSMPEATRLLDAVLDDRLVHQRQHLLRLRLGGRQEAGAETGGGEDGLAHAAALTAASGLLDPAIWLVVRSAGSTSAGLGLTTMLDPALRSRSHLD